MCRMSGEVRYYFCFNEISQFGMNLFYHAFFDQNNRNFRPNNSWFVCHTNYVITENELIKNSEIEKKEKNQRKVMEDEFYLSFENTDRPWHVKKFEIL